MSDKIISEPSDQPREPDTWGVGTKTIAPDDLARSIADRDADENAFNQLLDDADTEIDVASMTESEIDELLAAMGSDEKAEE